jgi:hypothetical protein
MDSAVFPVRRIFAQVYTDSDDSDEGTAGRPLRKVLVAAVVRNPYAGRYVEDLSPAVKFSESLGTRLAEMAVALLGEPVVAYGKGGIAGLAGEQEHAVMFLTTAFGDAVRKAIGGGRAWISSTTVVGPAGRPLTVPLAHKDALYVRENYDAVTLYPDDAPRPDEVVVALAVANRGRLHHRLGGLSAADLVGEDGLT